MGRIRQRAFKVDDELWGQFIEVCRKKDLSASQMIRQLIRHLIEIERDRDDLTARDTPERWDRTGRAGGERNKKEGN